MTLMTTSRSRPDEKMPVQIISDYTKPPGVTVTITGRSDYEVRANAKRYVDSYHPAGYGTHIVESGHWDGDLFVIKIWRAASCD